MSDASHAAYLLAAAAHAGFQATISLMVYPALARVRAAHWRESHDRHSKAITPLVGIVYAALVATGAWLLVVDPSPADIAAVVPSALTIGVTATLAAPVHGRLHRRDDALLARLLVVDRVRLVLALLGVALAYVAVVV